MASSSDEFVGCPIPGVGNQARRRRNGGSGRSSSTLQDMAAELADIRRIVGASQAQSEISQRRANVLSVTNSRLRKKLGSLSKRVEQARQFAYYDELTGLPNRALLVDRLQQAMDLALRQRNRVALVLLNLDGFDGVNHTVGEGSGDRLLRHVACELKSCLRGSDTVCRYGGAEFVIMLPAMGADIEAVTAVVRRIRARLATSFVVAGRPVAVTFSAGLALYPGDGGDCVELLTHADLAMSQAKASSMLPTAATTVAENIALPILSP